MDYYDRRLVWRSIRTGGLYKVIDVIDGAGTLRGTKVVLYGGLSHPDTVKFVRTVGDFLNRMEPTSRTTSNY